LIALSLDYYVAQRAVLKAIYGCSLLHIKHMGIMIGSWCEFWLGDWDLKRIRLIRYSSKEASNIELRIVQYFKFAFC
jgi:hypothetical protein